MAKRRDELLFERALGAATAGGGQAGAYMGDPSVLRAYLLATVQRVFEAPHRPNPEHEVETAIKRLAYALVGSGYPTVPAPVAGLHEPGHIDVHLARELRLPETEKDPYQRCRHAVVMMLRDLQDIDEHAGQPGVQDEEWLTAAEGVIDKYTQLFLGIPLHAQVR